MKTYPVINPSKLPSVQVEVLAGLPTKLGFESSSGMVDFRWKPFTKWGMLGRLLKGSPFDYTVVVDKNYLPEEELALAADCLQDYYTSRPKEARNTEIFNLPDGIEPCEYACAINEWIAIINYFGPEAPYCMSFLEMMRPIYDFVVKADIQFPRKMVA